MTSTLNPAGLDLIYVAIWQYAVEDGAQVCTMRPVCRLCGWRGRLRATRNFLRPEETSEGEAASREGLSHWAGRHPTRPLRG